MLAFLIYKIEAKYSRLFYYLNELRAHKKTLTKSSSLTWRLRTIFMDAIMSVLALKGSSRYDF